MNLDIFRDMFKEPRKGETAAEYILPRFVVLFSLFCLSIAVLCVVGEYLPNEGLIR